KLVERRLRAEVAVEARRERDCGPLVADAGRPGDRIQDAVDDDRTDAVREQVRVGHAKVRSIRVARVREPRVADRRAKRVQIPSDIRGGHVIDDLAAALGASPIEIEVRGLPDRFLLRITWERERREQRRPLLGGPEARQRGASRDPARIEAEDDELRTELAAEDEWLS